MNERPPRGIARFDSAAAMAPAIGRFLQGRDVGTLSGSPLLDRSMPLINALPRRPREWAYSVGGMTEAVGAGRVGRVDFGAVMKWIVGLFPQRPYPAAFIGSSNGALTHLAAAVGAPWLPQTFLCPVRTAFSDPDDARAGFETGRRIVDALLAANPDLAIHHMQDPNQDRLMLHTMSYMRLKHRALPAAYRDFLVASLAPGATLYVDECTLSWPVTRTSERSVYQFGAVGGMQAQEYLHGSERVRAYLARYGVDRTGWDAPEPNDVAPEAEWGFDPAWLDELSALARMRGWRLVRLGFEDPESMSFLAAAIYRRWYNALGCEPTRLVVDSFVLLDPYRTLRLRALPLWLVFPVDSSADTLAEFLDREPPFDEIDLMLFSHGVDSVGVVPIETWRRLIGRARRAGRFLGVDPRKYPRDFATFIRFHQAFAQLGTPYDLPPPLDLVEFERLVKAHGPAFGIEMTLYGEVAAAV